MRQLLRLTVVLELLFLLAGCHAAHTPSPPSPTAPEDFLDLKEGTGLRVLIPIYAGEPIAGSPSVAAGADGKIGITVSAPNLLGYRTAYYEAQGRKDGRVRLRFSRSETTLDGKAKPDSEAPQLPFALPAGWQYVRLIYLVRVSQTDHNMAIVASKRKPLLEEATVRVKASPDACTSGPQVFCSWVPSRIAVRPEETRSLEMVNKNVEKNLRDR